MREVISNTSPLQYLHQIELLDLLPGLYRRVIVPQAVVSELSAGREQGLSLPDPTVLDWVEIRSPAESALLQLVTDLGAGEREAIAIAVESPGSLLILDDAQARRHAALLDVALTGTLGVLIRAKGKGLLEAVSPVVDRLGELGFRLDAETRSTVLRLSSEAED